MLQVQQRPEWPSLCLGKIGGGQDLDLRRGRRGGGVVVDWWGGRMGGSGTVMVGGGYGPVLRSPGSLAGAEEVEEGTGEVADQPA